MPATHRTSDPNAQASVSTTRGVWATSRRPRSVHISATETPPAMAALMSVHTGTSRNANGTSRMDSRGGNGENQPPSGRGTSSTHGMASTRCNRPATKACAIGQCESVSTWFGPTIR